MSTNIINKEEILSLIVFIQFSILWKELGLVKSKTNIKALQVLIKEDVKDLNLFIPHVSHICIFV